VMALSIGPLRVLEPLRQSTRASLEGGGLLADPFDFAASLPAPKVKSSTHRSFGAPGVLALQVTLRGGSAGERLTPHRASGQGFDGSLESVEDLAPERPFVCHGAEPLFAVTNPFRTYPDPHCQCPSRLRTR